MHGSKRFTRAFAQTVLDLLQFSTIKAVAQYLKVGWDMVKNIHKAKLMSVYRKVPLDELVYLGIDEFSIRKGHTYMTIFVDLTSGRIIHAVEGRSSKDIAPFLQTIAKEATQLKAVAIDMSNSYRKAVKEHLHGTDIVFDRYHISALVNRSIDNLRREQQRTLDKENRKTLKGSRFLLLRNYSNLNQDSQGRLKELLQVNQPLFVMHTMKEQLRGLWDISSQKEARAFLRQWCYDALVSGVRQLIKIGLTLDEHRHGILSYFKHRITNAVTEGLNNKIKTLKRQVYGFRDMAYFKLRLYHLHTNRYALSG
jgi:transposase